jgi:hypothetical protein
VPASLESALFKSAVAMLIGVVLNRRPTIPFTKANLTDEQIAAALIHVRT